MTGINTKGKLLLALGASLILLASFAFLFIAMEDTDASDSDGYIYNGSIAESLSDSNGINDNGSSIAWTMDSVRGYAIYGDYAYVTDKSGILSKIGIRDGAVAATADTGIKSGNDFPTVGGGYILDTASGNVYDQELKLHHTIPDTSSQGYYDDGYWYIVKNNKDCVCYPVDSDRAKWTSAFTFYIDGFTLPVSIAMNDGYIFYPGIGADDASKRILYCVDKETGIQTDMVEMTGINGTFWNSGFIFCQDDSVAVTTHWDNMYGPVVKGDFDTIFRIDVGPDGKFKTDTAAYLSNHINNSYGSCFVMVGDLAFAQTGLRFMVFNESGEIIASTPEDTRLGKTYSNIAVAAGDDGFVRGYVSPAGVPNPLVPTDGLICFEYNKKTNEIRSFDLPVGQAVADNTNPVKIGPNGEVLFAKNDGKLYCFTGPVKEEDPGILIAVVAAVIIAALVAAVLVIKF